MEDKYFQEAFVNFITITRILAYFEMEIALLWTPLAKWELQLNAVGQLHNQGRHSRLFLDLLSESKVEHNWFKIAH